MAAGQAVVIAVNMGRSSTPRSRRVELRTHAYGEQWTLQYNEHDDLEEDQRTRLRLEKTITLLTETLRRNR